MSNEVVRGDAGGTVLDNDWHYRCRCGHEVQGPERDMALADHYEHLTMCARAPIASGYRNVLQRRAKQMYDLHEELPRTRRHKNEWGLPGPEKPAGPVVFKAPDD